MKLQQIINKFGDDKFIKYADLIVELKLGFTSEDIANKITERLKQNTIF